MATIRPRGDSWEVRIRRKGWPVTCRSFDRKSDAEKWARQVESEMDRGVFVPSAEAESTTLKDALQRFEDEYVSKLKHPKHEIIRIKKLKKRSLASKFLAAIRSKDIADYIKERSGEGVSENTVRLDLAILSRLFTLAGSNWGMESLGNPVRRVEKPKLPAGRERRLNAQAQEEERLLAACDPNFTALIRFALETAMRRGEIVALEWQCVNFIRKTAFLPKTKNGEARTVPLSPVAIEILESLPRNISGKAFHLQDPDTISRKMTKACKAAGIENLHFHDLRHEAISRLFENTDLDMMEIKGITGHKTVQMLARYTHLRAARLADRLAGKKRGEIVKMPVSRGSGT